MGAKLDEIIKNINKDAKEDIITVGLSDYNYNRIPFTSPRMNYCTYGGIPVGKLIEFSGDEHSGKTTTALDIVANYQQMENANEVVYADCENTLDVEWAKKLGVDVDAMYILQPKEQSAEEIFQYIIDMIKTGEVGLWVIDSLGVMVSQQALEKDIGEKTYAGISQALTNFSKQAEMLMSRYNCTGIGINQMREDLNSTWGGTKTVGGRAWGHNCALRMEFRHGKFFDSNMRELSNNCETPAGNYVQMTIKKIKSAPPNRRTGFYTLNYEKGIDYIYDLIEVAMKYGVIEKSGAWFQIINTDTGEDLGKYQGQGNLAAELEDDTELCGIVAKLVYDNMYN